MLSHDTEERHLGHGELTEQRNHVERRNGQTVHHAVHWAQQMLMVKRQRIDCALRSRLREAGPDGGGAL